MLLEAEQIHKMTHISLKMVEVVILCENSCHWANFSVIVYIAVWIHVMFDHMNQNIGFYP